MTHPIFEFGDRLADEYAALHPVDATFDGVVGFEDQIDDYSPEGVERSADLLRGWLGEIAAMPATTDYWESLAIRVISERLGHDLSAIEGGEPYRDLNSIASPSQDLGMMFEVMDREGVDSWEKIITRLEGVDGALAGYAATLEEGRSQGVVAAQRQVTSVVKEAKDHAEGKSGLTRLSKSFEEADSPGGSAAAGALGRAIATARAGFGDLSSYLTHTYMPDAAATDPVGEERYLDSAARFLGADLDAPEVYEWGWGEVTRLRQEMTAAAGQIESGATIAEAVAFLDADPSRASQDRDNFIETLTELQLKALADLDGSAFRIPAEARQITVNISPPGTSLGAQYINPSEDFKRPGSVWYGLDDSEHQIPIYRHISTNYHEGFPGHHLQVVYQMANADKLTRFHRTFVWYSGSGEGWALYSEKLMNELGYFDRPEYVLNTHSESMLRACRVVIDIGSHMGYQIPEEQPFHPGEDWTFETATEMLESYALQMKSYAESEVTRYLGWPGQAITYKMGERQILDMRETLRARDDFDLIEFHHKVLTPGAIGLAHLRDLVLA